MNNESGILLSVDALWLAVENHLFTFIMALLMAEISAVKNQSALA